MSVRSQLLNDDAIADRRISVQDADLKLGQTGVWLCHYCAKRFNSETVFMRHYCEQKKRAQEISSPIGQAAYAYYSTWMKEKKFKTQSMDAFIQSRYYKAMLRFAEMVIAAGVSHPDLYVKLMVQVGVTPDLWCREQCYKVYLDWLDYEEDPLEQVKSSILCLMDLAEKEDCDYKEVIDKIGPQRLLALISSRKLSPWFLLHSSVVKKMLQSLDQEQLKAFDKSVNVTAWVERLKEHQAIRKNIIHIITEVGL